MCQTDGRNRRCIPRKYREKQSYLNFPDTTSLWSLRFHKKIITEALVRSPAAGHDPPVRFCGSAEQHCWEELHHVCNASGCDTSASFKSCLFGRVPGKSERSSHAGGGEEDKVLQKFCLCCLATLNTWSSVIELQYADDACVCAHLEAELQTIVNTFTEVYESMGLTLNICKTKVLYQPAPATQFCPPITKIHDKTLNNVNHFPYLGSLL
uniref:uncharacterized protein n=1 Tax=Pristiophorus japonicus TaxID=55135 RepID=UPI00398F341F